MSFKDNPEKLENPPDDYRCITKLHWSLLVEDRISEEFKVCEHVFMSTLLFKMAYNQ